MYFSFEAGPSRPSYRFSACGPCIHLLVNRAFRPADEQVFHADGRFGLAYGLVGRAESCVGRAKRCFGRARRCFGVAERRDGHTSSPIGHAGRSFGRADRRVGRPETTHVTPYDPRLPPHNRLLHISKKIGSAGCLSVHQQSTRSTVKLVLSFAVWPDNFIVVLSNGKQSLYSTLTGGLCSKIIAASARSRSVAPISPAE